MEQKTFAVRRFLQSFLSVDVQNMKLIRWFVLIVLWRAAVSLETVEELLCQNMEAGGRIPHPEFCNVYIICMGSAAMQISCERRVLYNPETEICDPDYRICRGGFIKGSDGGVLNYTEDEEANADYEDSDEDADDVEYEEENEAEIELTSELSETTTEIELTTVATERVTPPVVLTTQPQQPPPTNTLGCPAVDSSKLLLVSHPTKCSVYYVCYHGKPVPMECSLGLHWSEKHNMCVPRELSECQARFSNPYPRCPDDGIDFLPDDKNCQRFWFCRNGYRMLQQCDAFLHWDVNERKCKRIGQAVCYIDLVKAMSG